MLFVNNGAVVLINTGFPPSFALLHFPAPSNKIVANQENHRQRKGKDYGYGSPISRAEAAKRAGSAGRGCSL